jgi:tetratricopeptide (TPR) repeat protein
LSEPVQKFKRELEQAILERDFTAAMSSGYRYLDSEELAAARSAFSQAAELHPNLAEVAVALQSVSNAEISQRVGLLSGRARQAEVEEDWQQAVEAYSQILQLESGSIDGLIGQARAQVRLSLDRKLVVYRGDFDSLLDSVVREQARTTLNQARELPSAGSRLLEQIASISAELDKLVGEVNVQLVSDGVTDVRILRQSHLGVFQQEELILSPGKYVAVGSRSGFRDIRLEFVVRSGEPLEPLNIACTEAI